MLLLLFSWPRTATIVPPVFEPTPRACFRDVRDGGRLGGAVDAVSIGKLGAQIQRVTERIGSERQ
jgi:hypothetical protein